MALISPSILAADFANLQRDIEMLNKSKADYIHVDIMDGVFVPNISFGIPVCQAVNRHAKLPLDVHLMIIDPDRYIRQFRDAGAHIIMVHYEACNHLHRTIQHIKEVGALSGVAINPHTPVELLADILGELDQVLVMSVNPGFGGQTFIENTYIKIRKLAKMRADLNLDFKIEIDGGVTAQNAPALVQAGADVLVAGNFIFSASDPLATIADLKLTTQVV